MFKQIIVLVALSVAVSLSMSYAQTGIQLLLTAHDWISHILSDVFAGGQTGKLAKNLIALLSIPMLLALLPAIFYWIVRRNWFPYFMEIVWIIWLIQAGALLVMYKAAV